METNYQLIGDNLLFSRYALVLLKCLLPKKPLLAAKGDG